MRGVRLDFVVKEHHTLVRLGRPFGSPLQAHPVGTSPAQLPAVDILDVGAPDLSWSHSCLDCAGDSHLLKGSGIAGKESHAPRGFEAPLVLVLLVLLVLTLGHLVWPVYRCGPDALSGRIPFDA